VDGWVIAFAGVGIGFVFGWWGAAALIESSRREECDRCCADRMLACRLCDARRTGCEAI
jgi:hypothetical protein